MKKARTFLERTTQLGYIAHLEHELMTQRNQHGVMPRTNKAKRILWQYEINVFGHKLGAEDICLNGNLKTIWENDKFTTSQFQGN